MQTLRRFLQNFWPQKSIALDFVGYEVLLDFIKARSLHRLEGDLIEIGCFMGGGTVKLARFARKHGKRVFAVDIFDPAADATTTSDGTRMCDIYLAFLEGRSQLKVYEEAVGGLDNVVTIRQDSKTVSFPASQKFVFGFIDGNHQPDYVRNDFSIIWSNLVPGGVLGFHDYNTELPEVTDCIDAIIATHTEEITETQEIKPQHIILLVKRQRAGKP
ncbi:MAG: class I SAM-dependent methyltransferase [Dehalococcoidales bacterium]|nr:MAG: class I SAM-dependent methyltransferase [Dehalococcoidales bacterium]